MKYFCFLFLTLWMMPVHKLFAQTSIVGHVVNHAGDPLPGATVTLKVRGNVTTTDAQGRFDLPLVLHPDTLVVSFIGHLAETLPISPTDNNPINVVLAEDPNTLDEVVVNTGYYEIPAERATGSFSQVDNALLNRAVTANVLERLEGVVNGVQFVQPQAKEADGIRIRGLSTIESDTRPLIVLDNFPYEGDINTINPNDVESITVLRDAAAASIWGARAGNGVIVINTKTGRYNQPARISVNSNVTIGNKPDLLYGQNYLPSPTVMEIQKELFERGVYQEQNQTYIPSYVELMIKQRDGTISEADFVAAEAYMKQTDLRQQAMDHLYKRSYSQLHAINVTGGGQTYRYALSAGYHDNQSDIIGNENRRVNLSLQNTYRIRPNLEVNGAIWYTHQQASNNGIAYTDLGLFNTTPNRSEIYDALVHADGSPAPTYSLYRSGYREQAESMGLVDWMYRPLDEQQLADHTSGSKELRLNAGIGYRFLNNFNLNVTYQYVTGNQWQRQYRAPESYFVRNEVNRFTQSDGTRLVPLGGILELGQPANHDSHSGRAQLNFNRTFENDHEVVFLGGAEIRQHIVNTSPAIMIMDYDKEVMLGDNRWYVDRSTNVPTRPIGSGRLPASTTGNMERMTARNLSYFGNGSYTYKARYVLNGSVRWDGSNLLGVKANQRGTALWSIGSSWQVSDEPFYHVNIPYLRLRTTFGSAGNIDKSQSHYPTIAIGTNSETGIRTSSLQHPGNPALRWEQVNTFNAGIDWRLSNNRLGGSIEFYDKHAKYLLGNDIIDPTTGAGSEFKLNYANLRTRGWDIQLQSRNLTGRLDWRSTLLLNYTFNRITHINIVPPAFDNLYVAAQVYEQGESVDKLYAFPWYGLNPKNGYPLIYIDGQESDDYARYYNNISKSELVYAGVTVPPLYGSLRNLVAWRGIELSALVTFKTGYVFRRRSIGPGQEYLTSGVYHMDYFKRWKQPGDERHTDVPAWAETAAPNQRFGVYQYSETLITRGDHIRLQDVSLSYSLPANVIRPLRAQSVRAYAYARNLGILWRANRNGIDPDYAFAQFTAPTSFAVGLQVEF